MKFPPKFFENEIAPRWAPYSNVTGYTTKIGTFIKNLKILFKIMDTDRNNKILTKIL